MQFPRLQVRLLAAVCSVSLVVSEAKTSEQALKECGASAMLTKRAEERFLYRKAQLDRFTRTGSILALAPEPRLAEAAAEDVGNIAVIDDSDGVRVRRNPFNLQLKRVTFHSVPDGGGYTYETSNSDFDVSAALAGTRITGLDDDDTREIPLPFEFPFFGARYSSMFVNSDGNISFTAGDKASSDRNLARVAAGPPRICALFSDLDPTLSQQGVRVLNEEGRVVISWANVPFYGTVRIQTFQIALYVDGKIEITFGDTNVVADDVIVGISPGGLKGETSLVTLNAAGTGDAQVYRGTLGEVFAGRENYDVARALQRFYATHDDAYDNIFVFNALQMAPALCPQAIACTDVVRNHVTGYGRPTLDDGAIYGSPKRLEAVIDMGPVEGYPDNPFQIHSGRPGTGDTGLNIFGHEASHRYLAWASPVDGNGNVILLGRQGAHWSFNFNSEGSLVEGNRLEDRGVDANPRFVSLGAGERVSPMDQYFFGWRPKEEVPPSFVVLNSSILNTSAAPQPGARFNGTRRDVTIDELIDAAGGPRVPDHQVAPRKYRWAIIVITRAGQALPTALIEKLERYRKELPEFWSRVSEGRSELDMEFRKALDVSFAPFAEYHAGAESEATIRLRTPVEGADLQIKLEGLGGPHVEVPAEVVIPVGSDQVTFPIKALTPGFQVLTLRPSDAKYETLETRLRVNPAPPAPDPE